MRVGDTLFRRGDACVAAFIVQTGVVRLVGDDHGGDLADEHVEIPEEDDADTHVDPRPFGDARAAVRDASERSSLSESPPLATELLVVVGNDDDAHRARIRGRARVAALGPGDACGFAALRAHPRHCAAPSGSARRRRRRRPRPAGWVTVWELGMKDFHQTVGYAVDDKRHRFAALLRRRAAPRSPA